MNLDYYKLPFGAQLLLWTSRLIINGSCRTKPNKYDLVDTAYKKVGLKNGLFLLKDLLSYLQNKENFQLQSICNQNLIQNEINLINCIEKNKYSNYDNTYYIGLWSLQDNIIEFSNAVRKLSKSFNYLNLDTNLSSINPREYLPKNTFVRNNITH